MLWVANIKRPKRPELVVKLAGDLQAYNVDVIMVGAMNSKHYNWLKDKKGSHLISSILESEVFLRLMVYLPLHYFIYIHVFLKVLVIFLYRFGFRESRQSVLIMIQVVI